MPTTELDPDERLESLYVGLGFDGEAVRRELLLLRR